MESSETPAPARTRPKIDSLRIGIHLIGLFWLVRLGVQALAGGLTANPIQFVEQRLGRAALILLLLTLAVTPLVTLTGWKAIKRHRRALGLYTFFYASLHVLVFAVLDYGFDLPEILRLLKEKTFLVYGLLAGLILLVLAATSFKFWMKHMGKRWKMLHRSVYLAVVLVVLHYAGALKGSLGALSGDVAGPLAAGLAALMLLVLRIPPLRRRIAAWRARW
jgi:sulfoxide reductase heme-binding subunit YedZ